MVSPMLSLRASGDLTPALSSRGDSLSATALRDLRRYYAAIDSALREVSLSEAEWNFLRDILNGSLLDETTAQYLWSEVADADPEFASKWGIDADDLAGRIRTMPLFSRLAICDAVERWWREQRAP